MWSRGAGPVLVACAAAGLLAAGCTSGAGAVPTDPPRTEDQHVRAELTRSGGFTGLRRCASADTATLPAGEARRLRDVVGDVDLAALANSRANPRLPAVDVVVVRGPQRVEGTVDDLAVPQSLRPLIELLDDRAGSC